MIPDAASDSYPSPPGAKVEDPIIDVCEASTIVFGTGYFLPSENVSVSVSVSGLNASDAAVSGNTAAADGSLTVTFHPAYDGAGSYAIAFGGSPPVHGDHHRSHMAVIPAITIRRSPPRAPPITVVW